MIILIGSSRIPYLAIPLRMAGFNVDEIRCSDGIGELVRGAMELFVSCIKNSNTLIISDTPSWCGLIVMTMATLFRIKYVIVLRGLVFEERPSDFFKYVNRAVLNGAKGLIMISRHLMESMAGELSGSNVAEVIPCPFLNSPDCSLERKENIILTVTQFHFIKKIQPLLDTFSTMDRVLDRYPDLRWVVCGGGRHQDEFIRRRAECRNHERIIVEGHVRDLTPLYSRARIFLYFTGLDTFGLVINEAFLFGLPVVANKYPSTSELVEDSRDGVLVDTGLSEWHQQLYSSLCDLLDNPKKARALGEAGRNKVICMYSPQRIGLLLREFLQKIGQVPDRLS